MSSMLRLNRVAAGLTCDACGHRVGDPVPTAPAEEDIIARNGLIDRYQTTFRNQASHD